MWPCGLTNRVKAGEDRVTATTGRLCDVFLRISPWPTAARETVCVSPSSRANLG
jgi:hypothetical protein